VGKTEGFGGGLKSSEREKKTCRGKGGVGVTLQREEAGSQITGRKKTLCQKRVRGYSAYFGV